MRLCQFLLGAFESVVVRRKIVPDVVVAFDDAATGFVAITEKGELNNTAWKSQKEK